MFQSKDFDWLNGYKNKTPVYAAYKGPTSNLRTYKLKMRVWKKIFYANGDQKKAGEAIFISDKIEFKIKTIVRDKEGHYIRLNPRRRHNNYWYTWT